MELITLANFIQLCLLLFSATAAYMLTSKTTRVRYYGCVVGVIGQIFWMWSSILSMAWGVGLLTIFYTYVYIRGIKNNKE